MILQNECVIDLSFDDLITVSDYQCHLIKHSLLQENIIYLDVGNCLCDLLNDDFQFLLSMNISIFDLFQFLGD